MAVTVVTSACYFPPATFFKHFHSASDILVEAHEYFVKQTLRNRTYICGPNGKLQLIVPVKHTGGRLTAMKDILISYDFSWQKNHWRSLTSCYRNSPYFEFYEDELAPFFFKKEKFLFDMNEKILQTLVQFAGTGRKVGRTEKYLTQYSGGETDLRNLADPKLFFESMVTESIAPYPQVFETKNNFIRGLSILDMLFNEGRNTMSILCSG